MVASAPAASGHLGAGAPLLHAMTNTQSQRCSRPALRLRIWTQIQHYKSAARAEHIGKIDMMLAHVVLGF